MTKNSKLNFEHQFINTLIIIPYLNRNNLSVWPNNLMVLSNLI